MISLKQHIFEAFKEFKITEKWMRDTYDEFNYMYFDNELPDKYNVQLSIESLRGKALGLQGFNEPFFINRSKMAYGKYIMLKKERGHGLVQVYDIISELRPYIKLNTKYKATENQWEDTLLHEMIHLYTYKDGYAPKQAHGTEFRRKCNQVRYIAKTKYGKDYELEIYAKRKSDFSLNDEEKQKIIKRNKKKINSTIGIYLELEPSRKHPKRFLFVSKASLDKVLESIKKYTKGLLSIYLSDNSYEKMCNEYGRFCTSRTYKYFEVAVYPKALNYMKVGNNILNDYTVEEAKKEYIRPEINVIEIDKDINLSDINLEDIVNLIQDETVEIKGDPEIEKTIINGEK